MQKWLEISKFPNVEQTTYDRLECSAENQIYPILRGKVVGDITANDVKELLNLYMNRGLSFSTVKKAYVLLNEYFRTMYLEGMINKNPMENVEMIKKANFLSAQGKENLPECETKGMHSLRHTFATNIVNGVKQSDGTINLSQRDILGHTTLQITEMYYVKKDTKRLTGITDGFEK